MTIARFALAAALAVAMGAPPAQAQLASGASIKPWHEPAPGEAPRWIGAVVLDRDGVTVGRISRMENTAINFIDVEISDLGERYWVDKRTLTLDPHNYAHSSQTKRQIRRQRNRQGGMPTF